MSLEAFYEAIEPVPTKYMEGKKVIGSFCSYTPEEMIHAAGFLPLRLNARGHRETALGDSFLSKFNCTFCRTVFDMVLKNKYDFLEGVISLNSCDHIRRTFDNWKHEKTPKFHHFLSVPHHASPAAVNWFVGEMLNLKKNLEDSFNLKITEQNLKNSIRIYNESRELLRSLYEKRKEEKLKISGTEAFAIVIAATSLPKEIFNALLSNFLKSYDNRPELNYNARIMIIGSLIDNIEYVKLIEDLGVIVVTDSQCFGSKYFWNLVDETKEPIQALSERYLMKVPCSRMIGKNVNHNVRLEFVKNLIRDYYVDGVIFENLKFCDLQGGDNYMMIKDLKKLGVPTLELDREYILSGVGQMKTRVQAFLEVLS
ncbi:MAG: 2-hydroxyacyl-CoA dehydratase [Candidatus Lokiarchaeota archaeon]|nr:2-hydroxyacyl-CoA dehydratase [Candidatus Lokiarchaeota archaeon]